MKIAAVSIGNSNISAAVIENGSVCAAKQTPVKEPASWPDLIRWLVSHSRGCPTAAASVNPRPAAEFINQFPHTLVLMGKDRPIPISNQTRQPEEVGHDRLLCGYAALKLFGPPLLVVDFGTAITFNVIDSTGSFLGGAITPGLGLASASLARECALLPRIVGMEQVVPLLGKDTGSAIRSGLIHGYLGMVKSMIQAFLKEVEASCRTVATGGGAELFVANTSVFHHHEPFLLLKGIALAYEATQR